MRQSVTGNDGGTRGTRCGRGAGEEGRGRASERGLDGLDRTGRHRADRTGQTGRDKGGLGNVDRLSHAGLVVGGTPRYIPSRHALRACALATVRANPG
jgi:hypothetical protein